MFHFSFFKKLWDRVRGGDDHHAHIHKPLYPASRKIPEKEPSVPTPVGKRARPTPPPKQIRGGRATWYPLNGGARRIPWNTSARANSHQ